MALSIEKKEKINTLIYERAYEIEQQLSADDFFTAKICGLNPEQVTEAALKVAVKELKKEFAANNI
jgi:hypothetical protein